MLSFLQGESRLVGIKQCTKAVKEGNAEVAYLANGVAPDIAEPFRKLCETRGVTLIPIPTKKELGELCQIDVEASVAVVLKQK